MNEINFQSIFDKLQDLLPNAWDEIVFYAAYSSGSYSMKYYIKTGSEIIDCYSQSDVSRMQLIKAFMSIDKELTPVRKTLPPTEAWNVITMIVDCHGNMKTHFDYTDVSENMIEYTRAWEEKYL